MSPSGFGRQPNVIHARSAVSKNRSGAEGNYCGCETAAQNT